MGSVPLFISVDTIYRFPEGPTWIPRNGMKLGCVIDDQTAASKKNRWLGREHKQHIVNQHRIQRTFKSDSVTGACVRRNVLRATCVEPMLPSLIFEVNVAVNGYDET